jgi:ABC-type antimicrobial peptide transport system permease subunit
VRQVLGSILTGAATSDPFAIATTIAFLSIVVAAACFFPARRATRLDPATALRHP